MGALERWAGSMAVIGGVLIAVIVSILSFVPAEAGNPVLWPGMFVGIALLGAAVPGLNRSAGGSTGRLGRAAAWLSGTGAAVTVVMVLYFLASGQILAVQQALPEGPIGVVAMGASLAWLAGNLGFAVAVLRSRALPRPGAWLVLAGAFVPIALAPFTTDPSAGPAAQIGAAAFLLLPVGWVVLGVQAIGRPGFPGRLADA